MKKVKKVFSIFLNVLMCLVGIIAIIAIYSFIQINVLHKSYVNLFGYTMLQVKTGSMENTIMVGDIVIDKVNNKKIDIKVNDIITYKEGKSLITHRVVKISEDEIITKGDANNSEDDPIKKDAVVGKVVKIIPNIQIWTNVFKDRSVQILIALTLVSLIATLSIKTNDGEEQSLEESNEKED